MLRHDLGQFDLFDAPHKVDQILLRYVDRCARKRRRQGKRNKRERNKNMATLTNKATKAISSAMYWHKRAMETGTTREKTEQFMTWRNEYLITAGFNTSQLFDCSLTQDFRVNFDCLNYRSNGGSE